MKRTRRMTAMLAVLGAIVLGLGYQLWSAFTDDCARARAQAGQAELRLNQAHDLRDRILADRAARESLENLVASRPGNFDLYSFVNSQIKKHGVTNAKLTSKGATSSGRAMQAVSVEFKEIRVSKLIDVIHHIYFGRNLVVLDRLHHLRPSASKKGVDCEITFVSPQS